MPTDMTLSRRNTSFDPDAKLLVACLCASWCGTCRDYRDAFSGLAKTFPDAAFIWLDVEDDAELVGDLDVENFPTLLIQRDEAVLFFGVMLPDVKQLKRLIQALGSQSADEVADYIQSSTERRMWQSECNLRQRLRERELSDEVGGK